MKVKVFDLPDLLESLIEKGKWIEPSIEEVQKAAPFLSDPLVFLQSSEVMEFESFPNLEYEEFLKEYSSSRTYLDLDLPWLDIDKAVFIAVNKNPGDDIGIALDYRKTIENPRVVASNWQPDGKGCIWTEIAPSFSKLVEKLGIQNA